MNNFLKNLLIPIMLVMLSCDSNTPIEDNIWILDYRANTVINRFDNPTSASEYHRWCNLHQDNVTLCLPPKDFEIFSYDTSIIEWREYVHEEDIDSKVQLFKSFFKDANDFDVSYYKYEPSYKGPWLVRFYEAFFNIHNTSEEYKTWFDKNISNLHFLSSNPSNPEYSYEGYLGCVTGTIEWRVFFNNVSEDGIKKIIRDFKSFKNIENGRYFDYFDATYYYYNQND